MYAIEWMMAGEPDSAIAYQLLYSTAAGNRSPPVIDRESSLPWIQSIWFPVLDSVRADSRLQDLLEASGLEGAEVSRTPPSERSRPLILQRRTP